jgi:phosphorylated CTD-interacting factor 1
LTTQFCSAFPSPDVDGFFGSKGDFFWLEATSLREGWYELNPPFSPGIMKKMADRLMDLLNYAREKEIDVTFIVVVPSCRISESDSDKPNYKKTSKDERRKKRQKSTPTNALSFAVHHAALHSFNVLAKQCSSHIVLSKREHGYVEGSQHLRPTQFKESQYGTSVIVLKSKTDTNFDTDAFETDLREAFKSRHMVELQQRRDYN